MRVELVLLRQQQGPKIVVEIAKQDVLLMTCLLGAGSVDGGEALAEEVLEPAVKTILARPL